MRGMEGLALRAARGRGTRSGRRLTHLGVRLGGLLMLSLLTACTADTLNFLTTGHGYRLEKALAYGPEERQRLDLYIPDGAQDAPLLFYLYGGSWRKGSRDDYKFLGAAFARKGYIVAVPDYRLYPDVQFPEFVEDAARAFAWLQPELPARGGDPDRAVIMGHSAGAHIGALMTLDPSYLAAAGADAAQLDGFVGLAGPYGFNPLDYESTAPVFAPAADRVDSARPVAFADGTAPPLLLLHGTGDTTVLPVNTRQLAEAVRAAGGEAEAVLYDGIGHVRIVAPVSGLLRWLDPPVFTDVLTFLRTVAPVSDQVPDQASDQAPAAAAAEPSANAS